MASTGIQNTEREAERYIRARMMDELCEVMRKTGLSPIAVLRLAAGSIGSIYQEIAEAHEGVASCACGWRPHGDADAQALGRALIMACNCPRRRGLAAMQPAGTA